ncbi:carboxy-S-adenosyl-L-methionine synthase CmoA [soil metagenome]
MKVGHNIKAENANWSFGGEVPDTFVDHIRQSVPLYEEGHGLVTQFSDYFVSDTSTVYELGVSTGELLRKLAVQHMGRPGAKFIGLDVEEAMVGKARAHCADVPSIEILHEDARVLPLEKSDLIVSYYTMQFVPPRDRQMLFDKIYAALNWGGAFMMFEKVRAPDARFQDMVTTLYNDFKLSQGFSTEEIVMKTRSLKGIMEPFSTEANRDMLKRAGFVDQMTIQKYLCFEGFLAIK